MPEPLTTLLIGALAALVGLLFFWPERGIFWRWQQARRLTERALTEDALKYIHGREMRGRSPTIESIAGVLNITVNEAADLLAKLEALDLARLQGDELHLTPQGRDYALQIIRAHRLWERYLADETGFSEVEWHARAEHYEHTLSMAEAEALSAKLGHPTHDPHGDPIPTANGEVVPHGGQPLTVMPIDEPLRIVHLEDEPEVVYAQLVAEGLHAGMEVRAMEISPLRVRFWDDRDEHVLAPIVAANIFVVPVPGEREETGPCKRLSDLKPGQKGKVLGISPACRGSERHRLMDLGVLRDTIVEVEFANANGSLKAYRVRGALIALREEQANLISITCLNGDELTAKEARHER
jgi:DtxR family Mn-dependent transcriptional regulator